MKNKVIGVLLSVVISFALWLYVVSVVSPGSDETYYNIPVILQNENILKDRGLMITSESPTVDLRLEGNRTDLSELNSGNITVLANIAGIEAPGVHYLKCSVSYPGHIAGNAISILNQDPELVELKIEKKITKPIPVFIDYMDTAVNEGFLADKENVELDYSSVYVTGPEYVVSQIKQAVIQVDLTNQDETLTGTYTYTLCNDKGEPIDVSMVTTNVEAVNLTLRILRVKELLLKLNVVDGGGATEKTSSITIEPKTIRISGSDTLLENLSELELGTINLAEIPKDQEFVFPIVLPEGVNNETGLTEAKVNVQFPNLKTKKFNVTTINAVNIPENMELDMITEALEVTVRGPKSIVDTMKETDIVVTVDFAGAQLGAATIKAQISINKAFESVGAMGSYSVSATLQEPSEEQK